MKSHHIVAIGTWGGDKQQLIEYNSCIAVGIDCPRAKLRVSILLDTMKLLIKLVLSSEQGGWPMKGYCNENRLL